jgi:NAD(P)-dependent dehydrogenase (short-subunit alcohol dehydrogenase family)
VRAGAAEQADRERAVLQRDGHPRAPRDERALTRPEDARMSNTAREMEGRVALVTGGGRGMGRAAALALADAGARVMAVSRTAEELQTLAGHPGISTLAVSLAVPEGCQAAVDETHRRLGAIDILVSNAGMGSVGERPIWEQDPDVWYASIAINLHASFELIRLASRDMISRRWGRVVVVSSTAGLAAESPSDSAYTAGKHGVIGLVRAAALDLAPYGTTCNAVCPGWVRTEMAEASARAAAGRRQISADDVWAERAAGYVAGRVVEVDEITATILFLAGPQASGISGEAIRVALGNQF